MENVREESSGSSLIYHHVGLFGLVVLWTLTGAHRDLPQVLYRHKGTGGEGRGRCGPWWSWVSVVLEGTEVGDRRGFR